MKPTGEYGAEVLRPFTAAGHDYAIGDPITADTLMEWPPANRRAIENVGKIRFLEKPASHDDPAEEPRRGPGRPRKAA